MFVRWDTHSKEIIGCPSNVPGPEDDWVKCLWPDERKSQAQYLVWELQDYEDELSLESGKVLVGRWEGDTDPNMRMATRDEINDKHRELEIAPVMVFGEPFDCDERSEIRMRDAIAYWDLRPLEPGVFEEREIEGVVTKIVIWTKGDNTFIELTREQLGAIFNEMLAQRAVRGAILFASLRRFKDNPNTTLRDISDPANWGI